MKLLGYLLTSLILLFFSCSGSNSDSVAMQQSELSNVQMKSYELLNCMYSDSYYPSFLVDKCKDLLLELCTNIELQHPKNLDQLYVLTHTTTERINALQNEFFENGSEIETVARECLSENIQFIAIAYGYEANVEELIAPREW